jgi:hypothetical protein
MGTKRFRAKWRNLNVFNGLQRTKGPLISPNSQFSLTIQQSIVHLDFICSLVTEKIKPRIESINLHEFFWQVQFSRGFQ